MVALVPVASSVKVPVALAVTLLKSRLASKSLSADALAFDFRAAASARCAADESVVSDSTAFAAGASAISIGTAARAATAFFHLPICLL